MNKLSLGGPVWLASDIHLGPDNPQTSAAFFKFLARAREQAQAVILLGDIFNVWIGDDWAQQPPAWLAKALSELRRTGQSLPLYLLGGNRDFLINRDLAQNLHAHLLDAATILNVEYPSDTGKPGVQQFLIAHGDEFCSADRSYQRFRSLVRNQTIQRLFLSLPLSVRNKIALRARKASLATVRAPADSRYDIQDSSLSPIMLQSGLKLCIHGHTHHPGHFPVQDTGTTHSRVTPSSTDLSRWVLPDWEFDGHDHDHLLDTHSSPPSQTNRGGWIEINAHGIKPIDISHLGDISTP